MQEKINSQKSTIPYEDDEQIAFVKWFRANYPMVLIWSTPNGGHRNKSVALKMKLTGQTPGVPDLFIPEWRLFIEMKRQKGGTVSPEQKAIMAELVRVGYVCQVCNGYAAAKDFVLSFVDAKSRGV